MRIISGEFKKRRLQGPPDDTVTRPIPDLVKESLFNILRGHCEDGPVLDCFAGTGSIGLEALSRGAPHCTFVERDRRIAQILRANIEHCQAGERSELVVGDALGPGALSRCPRPLHLAFFDPPYALVRDRAGLGRVKAQVARAIALLDESGYAVLRTPWPLFHESGDDAANATSSPGRDASGRRGRREHPERGGADPERPGRRLRRSADPPRVGALGSGRGGGDGEEPDDLDDMQELEIDLSTPEGQALLKELIDSGAIDADDAGGAVGAEASGASAGDVVRVRKRAPGERADLSIPGAIGPETHPYSGMAVHLYMRARSGAPAPGHSPGM